MSPKSACLACRTRKVKCVPTLNHRCERCTALGLEDCVYKPIQKRGAGRVLPTGEACKPCRTRKRRCDAGRPYCTTCINAYRTTECEYETGVAPPYPQPLYWGGLGPSGSVDSYRCGAIGEVVSQLPTNTVLSTRALIRPLAHDSPLSHLSPGHQGHTFNGIETYNIPHIAIPHLSATSSFVTPSIPAGPHVILSSLGAGRFQLSDTALEDLNMKFRLKILCRLNKLGIRFTSKKQQALLRGDTSGAVLHPFFVYGAQALGMYFCEGTGGSPAMVYLHAKYIQMSSEFLMDIFKTRDWEMMSQATVWTMAGSIILRLGNKAHRWIQPGCEAVTAARHQIIPECEKPPEFSEELHEKLSILTQAIYFENFLFLACGGVEPTMTVKLEAEFRHQLRKAYPVLFKICPLTMRTQAILLVRDTVLLLSLCPTDGTRLTIWKQSCDQLAALLDDCSQTLLSNLWRFQALGDTSGAGSIRASCVVCLAHLALLCNTPDKVDPAYMRLEALCDSSLERLGALALDMRMEEYTALDLLLGASWKKSLGVFDARLADISLERGTKLRYWREIVARVHSGFAENLPDTELPTFATGTRPEGDRIDAPRYQNLMLLGVEQ